MEMIPPPFATVGGGGLGSSLDGPTAVALQGPGMLGNLLQAPDVITPCSIGRRRFTATRPAPRASTSCSRRTAPPPWRCATTGAPRPVDRHRLQADLHGGDAARRHLSGGQPVRRGTDGHDPGDDDDRRADGGRPDRRTDPARDDAACAGEDRAWSGDRDQRPHPPGTLRSNDRLRMDPLGRCPTGLRATRTRADGRFAVPRWRPTKPGRYELWASYPSQPGGLVADTTSPVPAAIHGGLRNGRSARDGHGRSDPRAAWRQPPPWAAGERSRTRAPSGLRARATRVLADVFEASEDENKRVILRLVASGTPRQRMLDLGCFNGGFTLELGAAARAREVVGVEWMAQHAAAARARGVEVVEADLNAPLPFDDGSFDFVHANQLIEHLRATDGFLREVRRVCAPSGRVVLATNNLASWHNIGALVLALQPLPNHVLRRGPRRQSLRPAARAPPRRHRADPSARLHDARAARAGAAHGLLVTRTRMNGYYPLRRGSPGRWHDFDPLHAAFVVMELRRADS